MKFSWFERCLVAQHNFLLMNHWRSAGLKPFYAPGGENVADLVLLKLISFSKLNQYCLIFLWQLDKMRQLELQFVLVDFVLPLLGILVAKLCEDSQHLRRPALKVYDCMLWCVFGRPGDKDMSSMEDGMDRDSSFMLQSVRLHFIWQDIFTLQAPQLLQNYVLNLNWLETAR